MQGAGNAEEALLPEEEDDDEDFMLDLDELAAATEDFPAPSAPTVPSHTRFGGSVHTSLPQSGSLAIARDAQHISSAGIHLLDALQQGGGVGSSAEL